MKEETQPTADAATGRDWSTSFLLSSSSSSSSSFSSSDGTLCAAASSSSSPGDVLQGDRPRRRASQATRSGSPRVSAWFLQGGHASRVELLILARRKPD